MLGMPFTALALGAAALAASGCGGSSKTSSAHRSASSPATPTTAQATTPVMPQLPTSGIPLASGKPLSKAEWIGKGEAICTRTNTKNSSIGHGTPEYATALPQLALNVRQEARELSRLVPPASKAHDWSQIVNGLWLDGQYISNAVLRTTSGQAAAPSAAAAAAK